MLPKLILDKHCFIPCPPDVCDCKNGNPVLWELQQAGINKYVSINDYFLDQLIQESQDLGLYDMTVNPLIKKDI